MRWTKFATIILLFGAGTLFAQGGAGSGAAALSDQAPAHAPASGDAAQSASVKTGEAAPGPILLADDPAPLLGAKIAETIGRFGAPNSVYAVRGAESWQDDVAFAYTSGFTFFLFGDHLWQIRLTPAYAGSIYGIFLGDASEKVLSTLGQPYEKSVDSFVYRMPYRGYPVKLRLVFTQDKLVDVYLYRADF
jgi:hypothetical protein